MAEKSTPTVVLSQRVQNAAKVMKITEDHVWVGLEGLGIGKTDEDAIVLLEAETTREGDARRIFVDNLILANAADSQEGVSVAPARFLAGWKILKGKADIQIEHDIVGRDGEISKLIETIRPTHTFSDHELLTQYGPEASTEIVNELLTRSNKRPFIIYEEDNDTIDHDNTINMLRTARRHETKQYHVVLRKSGKTEEVRLYRADEFPQLWLEESPLHPGVILVDGYCDKCGDTWKGIQEDVRIVLRVARDMSAVKCETYAECNDLIKKARKSGANEFLEIPAVSRRYKELEDEGNLPKLKKRLSATRSGKQDPLFQHKTY